MDITRGERPFPVRARPDCRSRDSCPLLPYLWGAASVVARTRTLAYQYYVVMKYLDNLIEWGDSLFLQDTIETINEATLN